MIVETSGADEFRLTRKFYENLNYHKEATIRDFWSEGDDKVIYWKKLNIKLLTNPSGLKILASNDGRYSRSDTEPRRKKLKTTKAKWFPHSTTHFPILQI